VNRLLARTEKVVGPRAGLLGVSDLAEQYRELGRHAIANGWKLRRTSGGHVEWRSADGQGLHYSASTPGDWRAVRNTRAHLERLGLPGETG
jgi:hypothetical protein